jgi:hypothetical protein
VLVRGALIVACIAAVVFLAGRLHQQRRCDAAARAVFLAPRAAGGSELAHVRACRDPEALAAAAVALEGAGRHAVALGLARTATRRAPRDFAAWVGLALVERASAPALAARAEGRARALNPRWPGLGSP